MTQRDLSGSWNLSTPDESRVGDRVVRRAVGPVGNQRAAFRQQASDAIYLRYLEGLLVGHRRQNRGQASSQQRLAASGRPAHQQVVSSSRRHFDRPLRMFLSPHVSQIRRSWIITGIGGGEFGRLLELRNRGLVPDMGDHLLEPRRRDDRDAVYQRSLLRIHVRDEYVRVAFGPADRDHRKDAPGRSQRAVQGQFTEQQRPAQFVGQLPGRDKNSHGNRKVVARPGFLQVSRRKADRYPPHRELGAAVPDRGAHALA